MVGPFHWDGHHNSIWASSSSSVSRFCFFIPMGYFSAWHPQLHKTDIASLTSGHGDPSSIRFAHVSTSQAFSTFQPKEVRTDGEASACDQETQMLRWRGSFIPSHSFSSMLVSFEEERVVNLRGCLSSWLLKVRLVLYCVHAHHFTVDLCFRSRFTSPLLLRLRNTSLVGGQVASHLWDLEYGCIIDCVSADHRPVSWNSLSRRRPLWEPSVSFLRGLMPALV